MEGKRSEVMTWTSPKRFGNSSGPTAPLPGCEFLWSVSPPSCKNKKTRRYNERVMIPCAWLPSLLGAVAHDQARHHPKKGRVCFGFFFKLPPGGGCSGCDLLVTCIRCSRGSSTVFQVVCHVQVWWWFIWCEVDDGSGEKRATSPGAMDGCFCSVWCWKCILDLFIVRFGPCCPPFI